MFFNKKSTTVTVRSTGVFINKKMYVQFFQTVVVFKKISKNTIKSLPIVLKQAIFDKVKKFCSKLHYNIKSTQPVF